MILPFFLQGKQFHIGLRSAFVAVARSFQPFLFFPFLGSTAVATRAAIPIAAAKQKTPEDSLSGFFFDVLGC